MQIPQPTQSEICARAYELYVQRGRIDGYDVDDWLQAEYELIQLPVERVAQLEPPRAKTVGRRPPRSLVTLVRSAI